MAKLTRDREKRTAAEYVRMSTDHQKYSTENQAEAIRRYAAARAIDIVKTSMRVKAALALMGVTH